MGAGISLLSAPNSAHADGPNETKDCATAYEQTQRLQQKSEFLSALDSADRCARPSCPALLKDECARWVNEIRPKLPSLLVRVKGSDGCNDPADAKVEVSGASRKDPTSGALFVDPGTHEIVISEPTSGKSKKETINFAPGERRDIDVDFAAPDAVCVPKVVPVKSKGFDSIPKVTLVLGAVGGGLLLVGGGLGLIGAIKRGDLDDCKPNCAQEEIDGVRPFFVAGDVFAAFGILALGAGIVTYFARDTSEAKPAPATPQSQPPGPPPQGKKIPTRIIIGPTGVFGTF